MRDRFDLSGRVVVITGGGGLLGRQHALAVAEAGGLPVLLDLDEDAASDVAKEVGDAGGGPVQVIRCDITAPDEIARAGQAVVERHGRVDVLVNNAARNPKAEDGAALESGRLETLSMDTWNLDLAVGLTGAFLCSRVFGTRMASDGGGVILNIASDLGIIAPDQRIYRRPDLPEDRQPRKPVTYSVVKHGLIGLTRYLATYWARDGVRVNALCPGGVFQDQPEDFVARLTDLIPMGRMADEDEYRAAVVFLISEASSYMTGATLVVDGGRTAW